MNLEIQIQSIFISFIYGLFYSLVYNILYFVLYSNNKVILLISNILFNISLLTLFFYLMYLINNANIHPYFICLLILGLFVGNNRLKKIRIMPKKKERK